MHLPRVFPILAGALLCACASTPAPPPAPSAPPARPALAACRLPESGASALCGVLTVPEDAAQPQGRQLGLRVVVLPATRQLALPPLVHLDGGPGIPATGAAEFYATAGAAYRTHRDVVLMDARGTGGSAPLECPVTVAHPLRPVLDAATVAACRERLAATADLARYGTADAVQDIERLRQALGHERLDLVGLSYGTRVAQEYARAYPQHVRAMALLAAVSPADKLPVTFAPNAAAVLEAIGRRCRADRECRAAIPSLSRDVALLRGRLAGGPVAVTLPDGTAAELAPGPFWEAVRAQLTTTGQQRRLPWLLHEAAQGRYEPLLAAIVPRAAEPGANAVLLSASCAEDTLHLGEGEIAAAAETVFGRYRADQQLAACRAWGVPAAPRPEFLTGDVPVLLMSGSMDHVTPPAGARAIAQRLPNARVVVIPELGHFPDGVAHMECYDAIINRFFELGSARDLDLGCVLRMQPPPFELPRR
jgi:pimeloyl-ACP methyl ester carboxylesterase